MRPVDFRWDYRDAYFDYDPETHERTAVTKDGSRKRNRFHHGLIAQEVKSVSDSLGIDFAGYQDHKVNGGGDVLTIGYSENSLHHSLNLCKNYPQKMQHSEQDLMLLDFDHKY